MNLAANLSETSARSPDRLAIRLDDHTMTYASSMTPAHRSSDHALDVIVAERACERLLYDYARCIDRGDAADVAELFTDDAVWLADDIDMRGREAIRKAFNGRQSVTRRQSRHVITNVLVDLTSSDEAQAVAYLVNYRHDSTTGTAEHPAPADHPKLVGEYHLEFRHVDGAWRIASLRFDVAFLRSRPG